MNGGGLAERWGWQSTIVPFTERGLDVISVRLRREGILKRGVSMTGTWDERGLKNSFRSGAARAEVGCDLLKRKAQREGEPRQTRQEHDRQLAEAHICKNLAESDALGSSERLLEHLQRLRGELEAWNPPAAFSRDDFKMFATERIESLIAQYGVH